MEWSDFLSEKRTKKEYQDWFDDVHKRMEKDAQVRQLRLKF